jgi:acetolactate synthase-1/2/3 large subunit
MTRVADVIFNRLKQETSCVYMVSGGGAMYLTDALGRSDLPYVAAIHEAGAGFMAIGHAMATNRLGVCLITSGPGSTNVLTAVAAAWMDSIPVLFISGQAKSSALIGNSGLRTRGVQETDIISMVKPITKIAHQLVLSYTVMGWLDNMIEACTQNRPAPCWLSVPLDIQGTEIE